jgi:2-polyprenyl-3-methyl-5-hydroxy-6-metoxy-1,4-benzoquinol methylase
VAGCCTQSEVSRFFNRRVAAKDARRYRRSGLTGTARTLTELARDVRGASVLDVGGGIGAIELELLRAGAARATSIELSGAYEPEAEVLLAEHGLAGQVERRVGDFVADGGSIEQHDIVVLHRVVCCYPDADALVGEASGHTRRTLLLTYPQDRRLIRAGVRVVNLFLRLSRCGFRTYAHRVEKIVAVAARNGLTLDTRERSGVLWESASFSRSSA